MYIYSSLDNVDIQIVHRAFLEAFSDYQVNFDMSLDDFQIMMQRRGFAPELSIGAFTVADHVMVGFILNGLRRWNGKLTVYDTGTGVTPSHRKQGITSRMFHEVLGRIAQQNAEQYLLEVLQNNQAAFELYKKQGFLVARTFLVFRLDKNSHNLKAASHEVTYVTEIEAGRWGQLKEFWDFTPSWQNAIDSVSAVPEEFAYVLVLVDSETVGYGIVGKRTGDVPQFAVHKDFRRKGIAQSIFAALMQSTEAEALRILNIDDSCEDAIRFLCHSGAKKTVSQYEMILSQV